MVDTAQDTFVTLFESLTLLSDSDQQLCFSVLGQKKQLLQPKPYDKHYKNRQECLYAQTNVFNAINRINMGEKNTMFNRQYFTLLEPLYIQTNDIECYDLLFNAFKLSAKQMNPGYKILFLAQLIQRIKKLPQKCDNLLHDIYEKILETTNTPFNRDEWNYLALKERIDAILQLTTNAFLSNDENQMVKYLELLPQTIIRLIPITNVPYDENDIKRIYDVCKNISNKFYYSSQIQEIIHEIQNHISLYYNCISFCSKITGQKTR